MKRKNSNVKKYVFAGLILLTGLFDFFTFYFFKMYDFEINPIFVITQSIWFIFFLKFAVIAALIYMILRKKQKTYFSSYAFILVGLYLIIAQIVGGISNIETHQEQPAPEQALPPSQAVQVFTYISLLLIYFPLIMALLAFKLWEWIYLINNIKRVDTWHQEEEQSGEGKNAFTNTD